MGDSLEDYFKSFVREIADFPKPGIGFKDVTPLLLDPEAMRRVCVIFEKAFPSESFDLVIGPESRGFIFGVALATHLKKGFVPVRKAGKLPGPTYKVSYALEYGQDALEIHQDAIKEGDRVLIVDDLLATGGTISACLELVGRCGGVAVGSAFFIELAFLEGRKNLPSLKVESVLRYSVE
jgi:adenine phosphoribosyltransferase